jgi:membrane protein YqaA with SNARE-associated domain
VSFKEEVREAIRSRLETMRIAGFQPDDACVIGEMTNYAIGLLGNEACRRQFDEEKNAAARTTP